MVRYIDDHKSRFGVEPICRQLRIAPSTYYEQKVRQADPSHLPARAQRDIELRSQIHRVWHENFCACVRPGNSSTASTSAWPAARYGG